MGYWGIRSYENDDASDALDAGFEGVHGAAYNDMMDDSNPLTFEQVQEKLANPQTLEASLKWLDEEFGTEYETWDQEARLAYAGVAVRMMECGVPLPEIVRTRALAWLREETMEWDEPTRRRLRRDQELAWLEKASVC